MPDHHEPDVDSVRREAIAHTWLGLIPLVVAAFMIMWLILAPDADHTDQVVLATIAVICVIGSATWWLRCNQETHHEFCEELLDGAMAEIREAQDELADQIQALREQAKNGRETALWDLPGQHPYSGN